MPATCWCKWPTSRRCRSAAFIDEPDIGRLQMGQAVKISWDGLPGRVWKAKVSALPTNIVSRGSRMIGEVLCAVDNQDGKLLPNVNVTAVIVTADTANALTLPREALHQEDNRNIVYVVEDGRLVGRPVQTGVANLTRVEITHGLSENDTVALASLSPLPLSNGAAVKVVENQNPVTGGVHLSELVRLTASHGVRFELIMNLFRKLMSAGVCSFLCSAPCCRPPRRRKCWRSAAPMKPFAC